MPKELEARGVGDAAAKCRSVMDDIGASAETLEADSSASPDDVFKRLGGG